jgi:diaminopropionate ammonia-lyase
MFRPDEYAEVEKFYEATSVTPLHRIPGDSLGIHELLVKDESARFGLNAFKILGVRYAMHKLRQQGALPYGATVACATDGNHGRAVAHASAAMGLSAKIYLPKLALETRRRLIEAEGAEVTVVEGNYDDAVHQVAEDAAKNGWVIVSDTSWPGYEQVPRWIMAGYTHLVAEASRQWGSPPDAVIAHGGVGGFACAVGSWFAQHYGRWRPYLICAQPERAPAILEAARTGSPHRLQGDLDTIMDCLSAGEVSHSAWPFLHSIYDAYVSVEEESAVQGALALEAAASVHAGYSGVCGFAALRAILHEEEFAPVREAAGLAKDSRVLIVVTDGAI